MSPQSNIFFVNKSAKSKVLSRSEGIERKKIFSHVQQLPADLPLRTQELGWSISTAEDYHPNSRGVTARGTLHKSDGHQGQGAAQETSHTDQEVVLSWHIGRILSVQSPSPYALGCSSIDPFDCGAVYLNNDMAEVLKTYCRIVSTRLFTSLPWAQNYLHHHLTMSTDCPELLYAMLYSTANDIHRANSSQQHAYRAIILKGQALHHLHQSLELTNSTQTRSIATMRAITFLLYIECGQGNLETARHHYKALQKILETMKDVDKTPLAVRTGVMIPSLLCAAILAERALSLPIFEGREDDETKRFAAELLSHQDLEVLTRGKPSRFSAPDNKALIGQKLSTAIDRIHELERLKQTCSSTNRQLTNDEVRLLFGQRLAIAQQFSAVTEQPDPFTAEQHAVRLALYLCYAPIRAAFDVGNVFNQRMAMQVRSALGQTDLVSMWAPCSELLLWVLAVTFAVFHDEEGMSWMALRAAEVKGHLCIQTMEEFEEFMSGYVYPRKQFGGSLKRLWRRMEAVRSLPICKKTCDPEVAREQ